MPHNCKILNETDIDLSELIDIANQLLPHAQSVMGFTEPVTVSLISDQENSINPLGKTAYYDPGEMAISLFVDGRHPKDILRSLSHELVHHTQNCNGMFDEVGEMGPGYAQENKHLREMEREAYEMGNMFFRDWEDEYKKKQNWELNEGFKDVAKNIGSFLTDPERGAKGMLGRGVASIGGDKPGFFTRGLKGFLQAADPIGSFPKFSAMKKTKPYFSDEPSNPDGKGPHWEERPKTIDPDISRYSSGGADEAGEDFAARAARTGTVAEWIKWIMLHDGEEDIKKAFYSVVYDDEVESTTKMSVYKKYSKIISGRPTGYDQPPAAEAEADGRPEVSIFRGDDSLMDQLSAAGVQGADLNRVLKALEKDLSALDFGILEEARESVSIANTIQALGMIADRDQQKAAKKVITNLLRKLKIRPLPSESHYMGMYTRWRTPPPKRDTSALSETIRRLIEQEQLNYQDHVGSRFQATADNFLENTALGADPYDIEVTETGFKVVGVPEGREDFLDREFTPEGTEGYNPMHWRIAMRELGQAIDIGALQRPTNLPTSAPVEQVPALQESLSFSEELKIRASVQSAIKVLDDRIRNKSEKKLHEYKSNNITSEEIKKFAKLAGLSAPQDLLNKTKTQELLFEDYFKWDNKVWSALTGDQTIGQTVDAFSDEGFDLTHSPFRNWHAAETWLQEKPPDEYHWAAQPIVYPRQVIGHLGTMAALEELDDDPAQGGSFITTPDGETHYFMPGGEAQWGDADEETGKRSLIGIAAPDAGESSRGWNYGNEFSSEYDAASQLAEIEYEQQGIYNQQWRLVRNMDQFLVASEAAYQQMEQGNEWYGRWENGTYIPHSFSAREMRGLNIRLRQNGTGELLERGTRAYYDEMDRRRQIDSEPCPDTEPNCTRSGGFFITPQEVYDASQTRAAAATRMAARMNGKGFVSRRCKEDEETGEKTCEWNEGNPDARWDLASRNPKGRFLHQDLASMEALGLGSSDQAVWTIVKTVAFPVGLAQGAAELGLDTIQMTMASAEGAIRGSDWWLDQFGDPNIDNELERDLLANEIINNRVAWSDYVMGNFAPLVLGGTAGALWYGRGLLGSWAAAGVLERGAVAGGIGIGSQGIAPGTFSGDYSVRRGNRYYGEYDGSVWSRMNPFASATYGYGGKDYIDPETGETRTIRQGEITMPAGTGQSEWDVGAETGHGRADVKAWQDAQRASGIAPARIPDYDKTPLDLEQWADNPIMQEMVRGDYIALEDLPQQHQDMVNSGFCRQVGIKGFGATVDEYGIVHLGTHGERKICGADAVMGHTVDQTSDVHYLDMAGGSLETRRRFLEQSRVSAGLRDDLRGIDDSYASVQELALEFGIDNHGSDEAIDRMFADIQNLPGVNQPNEDGRVVSDTDADLGIQHESLAGTIEGFRTGEITRGDLTGDEMTLIDDALGTIMDGHIEQCTAGEEQSCAQVRALTGWSEATLERHRQEGGNWQYQARIMMWAKVTMPYATEADKTEDIASTLIHYAKYNQLLPLEEINRMSDTEILQDERITGPLLDPNNPAYEAEVAARIRAKLGSRVIAQETDANLLLHDHRHAMSEVEFIRSLNAGMNRESYLARTRSEQLGGGQEADHQACQEVAEGFTGGAEATHGAMVQAGCTFRIADDGSPLTDLDTGKVLYRPYAEDEFISGGQEGMHQWEEGSFEYEYNQFLEESNYDERFALEDAFASKYDGHIVAGIMSGMPSEVLTEHWGDPTLYSAPESARSGLVGKDPGRGSANIPIRDRDTGEIVGYRTPITGDEYRAGRSVAYQILSIRQDQREEELALRWTNAMMENSDESTQQTLGIALASLDTDGDGRADRAPTPLELMSILADPPVTFSARDAAHSEGAIQQGEVWHLDKVYEGAMVNISGGTQGTGLEQGRTGLFPSRAEQSDQDWIPEATEREYYRRVGAVRRALVEAMARSGEWTQEQRDSIPEQFLHPERFATRAALVDTYGRVESIPRGGEGRAEMERRDGWIGPNDPAVASGGTEGNHVALWWNWLAQQQFKDEEGQPSDLVTQSVTRSLYVLEQLGTNAAMSSWISGDDRLTDAVAGNGTAPMQALMTALQVAGSPMDTIGRDRPDFGEVDYGGDAGAWGINRTPNEQVLASLVHHFWAGPGATDETREWMMKNALPLVLDYERAQDIRDSHVYGSSAAGREPVPSADDPDRFVADPETGVPVYTRPDLVVVDGRTTVAPSGAANRILESGKRLIYRKRGRAHNVPAISAMGAELVQSSIDQLEPGAAVAVQHATTIHANLSQQQLEVEEGIGRERVGNFRFFIHPDPNGTVQVQKGSNLLSVGQYSPSTNTIIITDTVLQDGDVIIDDPAQFVATDGFLQSYVALVGTLGLDTPPAIIYRGMYVDTSRMSNPPREGWTLADGVVPHLPEGAEPGDLYRGEDHEDWVAAGGILYSDPPEGHPDARSTYPDTRSDSPIPGAIPHVDTPRRMRSTDRPAENTGDESCGGRNTFWFENQPGDCVECLPPAVWDAETKTCREPNPREWYFGFSASDPHQRDRYDMPGDRASVADAQARKRAERTRRMLPMQPGESPEAYRSRVGSRTLPPVREGKENNHVEGFLTKNKLVIEQISKALSNKNIKLPRKKLEEVIRKQIMSNLKQGVKE